MRLGVADEPLVGLDRDRAVGVVRAVQQRRREPLLVAAVGDLADELVDEVAAVGEDQDAAGARGLDEADGGDGLAGAGRVLEPEAPVGARVLGRLVDDLLVLVVGLAPPSPAAPRRGSSSSSASASSVVVGRRRPRRRSAAAAVGRLARRRSAVAGRRAVRASPLLELGDQRGERAREGVDLVLGQLGAVEQLRRLLGEQALEPEHQRVVAAPLGRGRPRRRRRARPARRRRPGGGRCPGRGPRGSRPRAGSARA